MFWQIFRAIFMPEGNISQKTEMRQKIFKNEGGFWERCKFFKTLYIVRENL